MTKIEETRGCLVRNAKGRFMGIVKDLVYSPKDLRLRYPEDYLSLSAIELEHNGLSLEDLKDDFPLIIVDEDYPFPTYIFKPNIDYFLFIREPYSALEILRELIMTTDFNKYRYMSHTTPKWKDCLNDGVEPRTFNRFLELKTEKRYSMWCGNANKEFDKLNHACMSDDSGIIITEKTCGHISLLQYLLENDMLSGRLLYVFDDISNYYISFDIIHPKDFIVLYSMTGEILWER